jgi:hypothetical protein
MVGTLLLLSVLSAATVEVDVQPLVGPSVRGELTSLTAADLNLRTADGEKTFAVRDLLRVTVSGVAKDAAGEPAVWVELADGSQLLATQYTAAQGKAAVDLLGHGGIEVPATAVRAVRWASQPDAIAKQWRDIVAQDAGGDVIVVRRTDTALDQWEGVLHAVDADVVQFELDEERVSIPRVKLEGVVYYRSAGREVAEPVCQVADRFGAHWNVRSLRLEDGVIQLTSGAGVSFRLPAEQLNRLDFSTGNVVYLSDLEPASVQWTPFFSSSSATSRLSRLFQPRRDASFDGGRLSLAGKTYDKGLAIHSRTELVYRLAEDYRRLRAIVGIDDRVGEAGNVKLVISDDDRVLLEKDVSGKQAPWELDLDIAGVRRLRILVDFGEDLDIADRLNFCEARIMK